jgi:hypothetical protein
VLQGLQQQAASAQQLQAANDVVAVHKAISGLRSTVSRASRLEALHLLLKVSLDDGSKPQCIIAMREGGFAGVGSHMNTFKQPLTLHGLIYGLHDGLLRNLGTSLDRRPETLNWRKAALRALWARPPANR